MIWLAVFAQMSAPVPLRPLVTADDVPIEMLKDNVLQSVRIALVVRPDGRVQSCHVEQSSGTPTLDSYTCTRVSRRAKFKPPRQLDGMASYGVYRTIIDWWVGDGIPRRRSELADLYASMSSLPANLHSPVSVQLQLAVDATGRVSDCAAVKAETNPVLLRLGCDELLKSYKPSPVRTVEGVSVRSVQTATVLFHAN